MRALQRFFARESAWDIVVGVVAFTLLAYGLVTGEVTLEPALAVVSLLIGTILALSLLPDRVGLRPATSPVGARWLRPRSLWSLLLLIASCVVLEIMRYRNGVGYLLLGGAWAIFLAQLLGLLIARRSSAPPV